MSIPHIIVLGGGYAGCMAANRIQGSGDAQVTLVNPRTDFVERIRLHQLAAGTGSATTAFENLLHSDVQLMVATADRIDAAQRTVLLSDGTSLAYDGLVYAVGSAAARSEVPGAAEFAYRLGELEEAQRLRRRFADALPDAAVTVVGGGLTGVEAASELAEAYPTVAVTLVSGTQLVPSAGTRGSASVRRRLRRLGVTVIEDGTVAEVTREKVLLDDGRMLPSDITVWTAGFGVPSLAATSGLATDEAGRLVVDRALRSLDDPRVVGAGDAVRIEGIDLRMSCQSAMPLGAQAANTVLSIVRGSDLKPVDQAFVAQCISLGRRAGAFIPTHRDDRAREIVLGGRPGALVKEQVCRMTLKALAGEARKPGSFSWPRGGLA